MIDNQGQPATMPDLHDLSLLIDSRVAIITISSHEEQRTLDLLKRVASHIRKPAYSWSITKGLVRYDVAHAIASSDFTKDPVAVLKSIEKTADPSLFVLCDYHPYFENAPETCRQLREIAMAHSLNGHTVVLLSHEVTVPKELSSYCASYQLSLPTAEEIEQIVRDVAKEWMQTKRKRVATEPECLKLLVKNLAGLSTKDVERLARQAIFNDGAITRDDITEVNKAKYELLDMGSVVSFEHETSDFANIGGLGRLKSWISQRKPAVLGDINIPGLSAPKGVLLLGVQGAGKSLAAKAIAGVLSVPLLRLDFATLYNKYIGESEKNLIKALEMSQTMSPCVLWMDEIEKGVGTTGSDNDTSRRLLGTLLTWMSEKHEGVFIVATANDIQILPPELIRKGRFDEIFFVDLPNKQGREEILRIHLKMREQNPDNFAISELADACDGFSGAEIEQAVVASLYSAYGVGQPLATRHVKASFEETSPLSVVMAEQVASLRAWASSRTVPAE
tara:strand:+ start:9937 stop:11451 length:1515 start_codon:yes stop_codon:yes gene_type:complete